ncbi:hypothetical protein ACFWCF_07020 [Rhodococcus sp. NPDC060090]|uniref:hypothetical protein n=1 Tax=Rhodococcus sp. NPDC060090 TaxID=3347056 RepID=UPI00364AA308
MPDVSRLPERPAHMSKRSEHLEPLDLEVEGLEGYDVSEAPGGQGIWWPARQNALAARC